MGLDGAYIQTAGISPSLARSCGFPSPALLLSSPSSPQGCTIAEIAPFSLEIGTVGFYSLLSTYVSGQKALWQSHKGRSSSHQKTLVIMSQDMAGATAVHMRMSCSHPLSLVLCGLFCYWWDSEAPGRSSVYPSNARRLVQAKAFGWSVKPSSDWLLCSSTYHKVEWEWCGVVWWCIDKPPGLHAT